MPGRTLLLLLAAAAAAAGVAEALHAYGHAYSRPADFSDEEIRQVADRFEIFTVEKGCAVQKYGPQSSTAATIGTAKRIKRLDSHVKVLMYWNAAINYAMYECEADVQPSWLIPGAGHHKQSYYNYSVPAFRDWWVKCAVDAVRGSSGLLDGLFLDATPKVADGQCFTAGPLAQRYWNEMVDQIRSRLGAAAVVIDNGFFLAGKYPHALQLAGESAWSHSGTTYTESIAGVGRWAAPPLPTELEQAVEHLEWVANAADSHPTLTMIGHGNIESNATDTGHLSPEFEFGLAKYMLVTHSISRGWFLANSGYSIDGGLLSQPKSVFTEAGVGCGEPTASFVRPDPKGYILTRSFQHGTVTVDVKAGTGRIRCGTQKH